MKFDTADIALACFITFVVSGVGCFQLGVSFGKENRALWHCESLGYQEFRIAERGTIECVKVTRETVK
jgi:hypothetical protein